ncbi:hypothetical protein E0493_20110 [Roseomonas sp. M0104]|uniref:DUF4412 domain-containing protein n=1 Tax=Teichococcus coralli TaxID=2545983 RepID=A0A845BFM0_9PROT|nr:hypothetical protein [Pseudoroseomonas coralli]MXP65658.1 hypothetical protein [Pseudoroseomonas coralli]
MRIPLTRLLATLFLAGGTSGAALAKDQPPAMPTRDVVVTYEVDPSPPTVESVAFLVAEGRIRTEGQGLINRVTHLIDTRGGDVTAVIDEERSYHDLGKVAEVMTQDILPIRQGDKMTREGSDRVAGQNCTVWRIEPAGESTDEEARHACITADGVPLRLREGEGSDALTLYVATEVRYGAQDPARFRVPSGYKPITEP